MTDPDVRSWPQSLLPVGVLAAAIGGAFYLFSNPPEPARRARPPSSPIAVEARILERAPYQIVVESFGFVEPRTQSMLVAQVGGQIVDVSPDFRDGGFFEVGERLLLIDPRDYEIRRAIAAAALVTAEQALVEERARVTQALGDWERLGDGGSPPPLVSREPQLHAAEAAVASARAALEQARLDLQRTAVIAPYDGRIRARNADLGQVVTANGPVAEIYATDVVEIPLPIKNHDLPYVELPEQRTRNAAGTEVELISELSPGTRWQASLVRTEGAIDADSRQLRVVAQIESPYADAAAAGATIKIGQYVVARIAGRTLPAALVVPTEAIYQGSYVYVVADGILERREIRVAWRNAGDAVVESGLEAGDALVLTGLGQVVSGTRARVLDDAPALDRGESGLAANAEREPGTAEQMP